MKKDFLIEISGEPMTLAEFEKIAKSITTHYKKHNKVMSVSKRIEMLEFLIKGEKNIDKIAKNIKQSRRNVERHVVLLKKDGYITTKKEGTSILCKLTKKGYSIFDFSPN